MCGCICDIWNTKILNVYVIFIVHLSSSFPEQSLVHVRLILFLNTEHYINAHKKWNCGVDLRCFIELDSLVTSAQNRAEAEQSLHVACQLPPFKPRKCLCFQVLPHLVWTRCWSETVPIRIENDLFILFWASCPGTPFCLPLPTRSPLASGAALVAEEGSRVWLQQRQHKMH